MVLHSFKNRTPLDTYMKFNLKWLDQIDGEELLYNRLALKEGACNLLFNHRFITGGQKSMLILPNISTRQKL